MTPPNDLSPEQRMRNALNSALAEFPNNSATLEALRPRVSRSVGRPVTPRQLEFLMNKYPTLYRQDNAGRWSLVHAAYTDDTPIEPGTTADSRERLRSGLLVASKALKPGWYVVFDLETMGTWNGPNQSSDIEILQIAAQRYNNYVPVGDPFVRLVKPTRPVPPGITHLTKITMAVVVGPPEVKEAAPTTVS